MRIRLAASALLGLAACLENPGVDSRLRSGSGSPPRPLSLSNTYAFSPFDFGTVKTYIVPKDDDGTWILAAESFASAVSPPAILLFQVAPATTPSCCGTFSPQFFPSAQYGKLVALPPMSPRQRIRLGEFRMPLSAPEEASIKVVEIAEGGNLDAGPIRAAGFYQGEFSLIRNQTRFRAGEFKAVIDITGKLGLAVISSRPDLSWLNLEGAVAAGNAENPVFLNAFYAQDSVISSDMPVSALRFTASGFELRLGLRSGDTVEIQAVKAAAE